MKQKFRIPMLLLVLFIVVGIVASCTNSIKPDSNATNPSSGGSSVETDEYGQQIINREDLNSLDFKQAEIMIASRSEDQYCREFQAETIGDEVDAKIFARNMNVENRLGVHLVFKHPYNNSESKTDGGNNVSQKILMAYNSGMQTYDIVGLYAYYGTSSAIRGCFVDYYDPQLQYIDLTQKYWNQNYIMTATIYDHLYYAVGDMNLGVWDKTLVTWTNMGLAESFGYDSLYEEVLDGNWTVSRMMELMKEVQWVDLDDSGSLTANDKFALTGCTPSEAYDGFMGGFDLQFIVTDESDGTHAMNIAGNERIEQGVEQLINLFFKTPGVLTFKNDVSTPMNAFVGGRVLFNLDILYRNDSVMGKVRDMVGYGVLPIAKLDEEQESYGTSPQDAYSIMAIINYPSQNKAAIGATLELLNKLSYEDVRPYYVERVLKLRYSESEKAVRVLEKIFDGVKFDVACIYGAQIPGIQKVWRSSISNQTTVGARYDADKDTIEAALANFDSYMMTQ